MKHINSFRQQRVAALINQVLVEELIQPKILHNYVGSCPITITQVKVSSDLRYVDVYFLPFNTTLTSNQIQKLLDNSSNSIRAVITNKVKLKYSPLIRFHYDASFDNVSKVEEILHQISEGRI